jgi:hypothetical protein
MARLRHISRCQLARKFGRLDDRFIHDWPGPGQFPAGIRPIYGRGAGFFREAMATRAFAFLASTP